MLHRSTSKLLLLLFILGLSVFALHLSPCLAQDRNAQVPAQRGSARQSYSVRKGDSLFLIAEKYQTTVKKLVAANNLKSDLIIPGQALVLPSGATLRNDAATNSNSSLTAILRQKGITSSRDLSILVVKSAHSLSILNKGVWLKTYHAEFGDGGPGDKEIAGDHKTPEGTFYVSQKSVLTPEDEYLGTRWLRLSYPNIEDAERGLGQKLIDRATYQQIVAAIQKGAIPPQYTKLGGGIGIHGADKSAFGTNWTWGCIGLRNQDVEEFYDLIPVGTKVVIRK
ncbi:MAG TPA: hypothetical protein DD789_00665 [Firmicutes bacterium]|nr:hypothetical protein [Bacillota bacterium]